MKLIKKHRALVVVLSAALVVGSASPASKNVAPKLRVPDGFTIEKVAGEPQIRFPMFACVDDRGRLFVAESSGLDLYAEITALTRKCRISMLEDRDGDWRFETATVFADRLVFPMGLAWRDGRLYVADPPELVALQDTDGDGKADKRTTILSHFGHKDNGSLHGLIFGPDGLLYMTMGTPDAYKIKRADGSVLEGVSGALLRCRPDGSEPEVLSRGFVNLVEVAFTLRGDVFGTDNWFQEPKGGDRDAIVHLVDGGLYPYVPDSGTRYPVTGEPLPSMTMFPAVALSGLVHYRGDAFPPEMRGNLFSAQHNARKVGRHVLVPEGSTFRTRDFDFVTTDDPDVHPSDVLEDADGSLLVVDTGSWYVHHCPTGQIRQSKAAGGIYRVRPSNGKGPDDPWGTRIDWEKVTVEQLIGLLSDRRPMVRERTQEALATRGKRPVEALIGLLRSSQSLVAKQHALWALASIPDSFALRGLRDALGGQDKDLVVTAARGLALRRDREPASRLCELLRDGAAPVRLAAAEALARCGDAGSLPSLWQALGDQPDRFLEHALIHAVHHIADAKALEASLQHPHPRVQKAAILLLDQPPRPTGSLKPEAVTQRLVATDRDLRQTALRILQNHPEWAEHALGIVQEWLQKPSLSEEERLGLRGSLLAFQANARVQELVAETIAGHNGKIPDDRRVLALQVLAETSLPALPASWSSALSRAIQEGAGGVKEQAVRSAAVLQVTSLDGLLSKLAENQQESAELRLEALRGIISRRGKLSAVAFELLLSQLDPEAPPLSRLAAAETLGKAKLEQPQVLKMLTAVRGDSLLSPTVLLPALRPMLTGHKAAPVWDYLADSVRNGWRPSKEELEKLLAMLPTEAQARAVSLREAIRQSEAQIRDRVIEMEPLLTGGSRERGREVFFGKKVACATCHAVGKEGGQVGPDLTRVGAIRSGNDLLESVVVPSSTIAQGFDNYLVAMADGRNFTGVIARQSADALTLRDSSGGELRLRKDQVQEMKRQTTSLMPEGLDRLLSKEELRDLLAYLKSLR